MITPFGPAAPVYFYQFCTSAEATDTTSSTSLQDSIIAAFTNILYDNYNALSTTLFTVPAGMGGLYQFTMGSQYRVTSIASGGNNFGFLAQVNGSGNTNYITTFATVGATTFDSTFFLTGATVLYLAQGDTVGLRSLNQALTSGTSTWKYQRHWWCGAKIG